jgi:hypothetical protein
VQNVEDGEEKKLAVMKAMSTSLALDGEIVIISSDEEEEVVSDNIDCDDDSCDGRQ